MFWTGETHYDLPFDSREEFEKAWPHVIAVKDPDGRLILESSPSESVGENMKAGVRVLCPPGGTFQPLVAVDEGNGLVRPEPELPRLESGELPEYVTVKNGAWAPEEPGNHVSGPLFRARIDIVLVVDGHIVDLNQIPLPRDTKIVDRRFPTDGAKE